MRQTAAHGDAAHERSLRMKKKGKKDEAKGPKKGK
jgi:hypothetical protein